MVTLQATELDLKHCRSIGANVKTLGAVADLEPETVNLALT